MYQRKRTEHDNPTDMGYDIAADSAQDTQEVDNDDDDSKPHGDTTFMKDLTVENIADSFAIAFAFALVIKTVMFLANYLGFHPQDSGGEEF